MQICRRSRVENCGFERVELTNFEIFLFVTPFIALSSLAPIFF